MDQPGMMPPPAPPPAKYGGPLKWILVGCGTVVLIGVLGIAGCLIFVLTVIKGTDAYKMSENFIRGNAAVKESLGDVKDFGFMPMGSTAISTGGGRSSLEIQVNGSKGSGAVVIELSKPSNGDWKINEAWLQKDGKEKRIDAPGEWGPIAHHARTSLSGSGD